MRFWKDIKNLPRDENGNIVIVEDGLEVFRATIGDGAAIHDTVQIDNGATIGKDTTIHSGATLQYGVRVGNKATIGKNATIYLGATIGDLARIGDNAQILGMGAIGQGASIGYNTTTHHWAKIYDRVAIGGNLETGFILPLVAIRGRSQIYPHAPGLVYLAGCCYTYAGARARVASDFAKHRYTPEQVEAILKTLDFFEAVEPLVFVQKRREGEEFGE